MWYDVLSFPSPFFSQGLCRCREGVVGSFEGYGGGLVEEIVAVRGYEVWRRGERGWWDGWWWRIGEGWGLGSLGVGWRVVFVLWGQREAK